MSWGWLLVLLIVAIWAFSFVWHAGIQEIRELLKPDREETDDRTR